MTINMFVDRKMNVLAKIVIPKTNNTIRYILLELEELAREDFFRLKCVSKHKRKKNEKVEPGIICPICDEELPVKYIHKDDFAVKNKSKLITPSTNVSKEIKSTKENIITEKPSLTISFPSISIPQAPLNMIKNISEGIISRVLGLIDTQRKEQNQTLKEMLLSVTALSQQLLERGTNVDYVPIIKTCNETISKLQEELQAPQSIEKMDSDTKMRLEHLKLHVKEVIDVTQEFRKDAFLSPSIENFLRTCENVNDKIDLYLQQSIAKVLPETKTRLEHLKEHIQQVEKITKGYETEGLLTSSVEEFLASCNDFKTKIDMYTQAEAEPGEIDILKSKVSDLEELTRDIKKEGLVSPSIENFMASCKEFKYKLNDHNKKHKMREEAAASLAMLKDHIEGTIELTKKAGEEGLITDSVLDFVKSCEDVKRKLEPINQPPSLLTELKSNINNTMKSMQKYKEYGLASASVEDFIKTCETAKAKIDIYETFPPYENEEEFISICSKSCICAEVDQQNEPCNRCAEIDFEYKHKEFNEGPPCNTCAGLLPPVEVEDEELCTTCNQPIEEPMEIIPYIDPGSPDENDHICGFCKKKLEKEEEENLCDDECEAVVIKAPSIETVKPTVSFAEPLEADDSLGYFETKVRKITRVTRTQNPDGTITEQKETIVVKQEKHDPNETSMVDDDDLDENISFEELLEEENDAIVE